MLLSKFVLTLGSYVLDSINHSTNALTILPFLIIHSCFVNFVCNSWTLAIDKQVIAQLEKDMC